MKKKIIIIISIFVFIVLLILGVLYFNYDLEVTSIKKLNFNTETNELTIEIAKKNNIFNKEFSCTLFNDDNKITENGKDNTCILTFTIGNDYTLILEDRYKKSINYNLLDYLDNTIEFKFTYETIYMAVDEIKK